MKRYRIKSKFRFITFCTVVLLAVILGSSALLGFSDVQGTDTRQYKTVMIKPGDTLWNLVSEYGPSNADKRYVIYEICRINNVDPGTLQPGTFIQIPLNL